MFRKGYNIYLDCMILSTSTYNSQVADPFQVHFSNYWADPSKQALPPTWPTAVGPLTKTVRKYVSNTLQTFKAAGVDLAIVSLGNEIRHGMLWPTGYVDVDTVGNAARAKNYTNLATIWAGARQGVTDAVQAGVKKPQVMIHVDNGWNTTLQQAWFGALVATGKVKTSDWLVLSSPLFLTNCSCELRIFLVEEIFTNSDVSLTAFFALHNTPQLTPHTQGHLRLERLPVLLAECHVLRDGKHPQCLRPPIRQAHAHR
jgi:hypothetical protein